MRPPLVLRAAVRTIPLVTVLAGVFAPARAATIAWTNASGGNWNNAANWNSGAGPVPGAGDDAVIDAAGTYSVTLDVDASVNSVSLGAASGAQTLTLNGHILTIASASTITANGILASPGTVSGAGTLTNSGTVSTRGGLTMNAPFATSAGSLLHLEGSAGSGTALATFANGFTNNGTIELTNSAASQSATLAVTAGTITNAAAGSINVLVGLGGGSRTINASLDNFGTVSLGMATGLGKSSGVYVNESGATVDATSGDATITGNSSFTQSGTLTIGATRTVSIAGGAYVHNAGLSGSGTLSLTNVTATLNVDLTDTPVALALVNCIVNGPGQLIVAASAIQTVASVTVNAPLVNNAALVVHGSSTFTGAYTSAAGSTLRVEGAPAFGTALATFANGFTNNGTIELTNSAAGQPATLAVTAGTITNSATRSINVLVGLGGGSRTINASIDNLGTVSLGMATAFGKSSGVYVNESGGTFDATSGDATITGNSSFTQSGTLTIGATHTLSIAGGAYVHNAGLSGSGALSLTNVTATLNVDLTNAPVALALANCIVNGPGQLIVAASTVQTVASVTVNAPLVNNATLVVHGSSAFTGAYTSAAGSTLRAEGSPAAGTGQATFANGFTNNGTIELTNSAIGQPAALAVTSGTITNAATRSINVLVGLGGGSRNLNASIDNFGTVLLGMATAFSKSATVLTNEPGGTFDATSADASFTGGNPSFTQSGALAIGATHTVAITGGAYVHNAALSGSGTLSLTNLTATLNVDLTNTPVALAISSCVLNGPAQFVVATSTVQTVASLTANAATVNNGTLAVRGSSAFNGAYTSAAGSTLRAEGSTAAGTGQATFANGFTNNGTIELTNSAAGQAATLAVTAGTITNPASRSINVLVGVGGGSRNLNASIDNFGTVSLGMATAFSKSATVLANEPGGTFDATNGNASFAGGNPSFTQSGALAIGATHTVAITSGAYVHNAALSGTGTLSLTNLTATLNVDLADTPAALAISSCVFNGPGQFVVAASTSQPVSSLADNVATVNNGTLIARGITAFNGAYTSVPGSTLRMEGTAAAGTGQATFANGFTNNGTIELTNSSAGQTATLVVTAGAITNAASRSITVLTGSGGGSRNLNASIDNSGAVSFGMATAMTKTGGTWSNRAGGTFDAGAGDATLTQFSSFHNAGTLNIGAGHTVAISGGATTNDSTGAITGSGTLNVLATSFTNAGTISPGNSAGILSITGNDPESAGAVLDIQLGGPTAGSGYDRLAISGAATLADTLNVSLINGFSPSAGDQFRVLTFGSGTGGFTRITGLDLGNGLSLDPRLDATGLTLVVVGQTWVHLLPNGAAPIARNGHSAVFDSTNDRMIVFGGLGDAGPLNDSWVLTHANNAGGIPAWIHLSPTGGPPPARANHSAVYDDAGNRMIVFGGDNATGPTPTMFGDVWVLSNANGLGGTPAWTPLSPTGTPPSLRTQQSAVYDDGTNTLIVFGGNPAAGTCASGLNDVWTLSHANGQGGTPAWTPLAPAGGPPGARFSANAAYDAAGNTLIVFGGDLTCTTSSSETWTLGNANGQGGTPTWTLLAPSGTPPATSLPSGVFDAGLDRLTVFGGLSSGVPGNGVLSLTSANGSGAGGWLDMSPTTYRPAARSQHSAVADPTQHRMIVFGGLGASGRLADVWELETTQGRIVSVPPSTPPSPPAFTGFSRPIAPNPARGAASFAVSLVQPADVDLSVHDLAGRTVATLFRGALDAGEHAFGWTGAGGDGRRVAPGIYLVRLRAGAIVATRRLVLLR